MEPIFSYIETVEVPAVAKFVAAEHFKLPDYRCLAGFREFLASKTELSVPARTLVFSRVPSIGATDEAILAELGDRAEIALAHLWELLSTQAPNDSKSWKRLRNDWKSNIFYVRGWHGKLLAVEVIRDQVDRWQISARSIGHPWPWDYQTRVFAGSSPNPVVQEERTLEIQPWQAAILEVPPVARQGIGTRGFRDLLRQIATVKTPSIEKFVAAEHFREDSTVVTFQKRGLGDGFKKLLLNLVETNVPTSEVLVWIVQHHREVGDVFIRDTLGDRAPPTLAQLWEMLKAQPNGEPGPLETDGKSNVCYILGADKKLWKVCTDCSDGAWHLAAEFLEWRWSGGNVFAGSYVMSH